MLALPIRLPLRAEVTLHYGHRSQSRNSLPLAVLVIICAWQYRSLATSITEWSWTQPPTKCGVFPYWFTSIKQIEYGGLLEGLFIGLWSLFLRSRGKRRFVPLLVLLPLLGLQGISGRRNLLDFMVLGALVAALETNVNPFKLAIMVPRWLLLFVALFVFSNVYQNFRREFREPQSFQAETGEADEVTVGSAAQDWTKRRYPNVPRTWYSLAV